MKGRRYACLLLALLAWAATDARAALVAAETFNYPPQQPLVGEAGGTGFAGGWTTGGFNATVDTYVTATGSLGYGGLTTSGGHAATAATAAINGVARSFASPLGAAGTTDYFSVLLRPDGAVTGGTFNNFFGLYLSSSLGNDVYFGKPGNGPITDYDVESRGGTNQHDAGIGAVTGRAVLLALRADFTAGVDKFTLYVDPTPGGAEPTTGTVKQDVDAASVTGLTLYATGAFSVDEIRVGTTFADVVPVPEPGPALLCLVGLAGAAGRAARKRGSTN
jgi:hypothetical protein